MSSEELLAQATARLDRLRQVTSQLYLEVSAGSGHDAMSAPRPSGLLDLRQQLDRLQLLRSRQLEGASHYHQSVHAHIGAVRLSVVIESLQTRIEIVRGKDYLKCFAV